MKKIKLAQFSYLQKKAILNFAIFAIVLLIFIYLALQGYWIIMLYFLGGIAVILSFFWSRFYTWYSGIQGEKKVASILRSLGNDFFFLNDIKLPGLNSNIDHLVLSKTGLFVIETKNHNGWIECWGDSWKQKKRGRKGKIYHGKIGSPSRQVKRNAILLRNFIKEKLPNSSNLFVQGIVVFTNENAFVIPYNATVPILKSSELAEFLQEYKNQHLTEEQVNEIKTVLTTL